MANKNYAVKKKSSVKEDDYRINIEISQYGKVKEVRVVGDNVTPNIYKFGEALRMAENMNTDLVEVSPNAEPPICKIMDFDKFLYEKRKKIKDQEKKNRENEIEVKEIRFTPTTDTHDFDFKIKHAIGFLKDGDKVKLTVVFKGREMDHKDLGFNMVNKFIETLGALATVETKPVMDGKRLFAILKSNKK